MSERTAVRQFHSPHRFSKYCQMTENATEGNKHKRKNHTNVSYFRLKGTTGETHTDLSYFHGAMKINSERASRAPSPVP